MERVHLSEARSKITATKMSRSLTMKDGVGHRHSKINNVCALHVDMDFHRTLLSGQRHNTLSPSCWEATRRKRFATPKAELKSNSWVGRLFLRASWVTMSGLESRGIKESRGFRLEGQRPHRRTFGLAAQGCHCSVGSSVLEVPQGSKSSCILVWTCLHSALDPFPAAGFAGFPRQTSCWGSADGRHLPFKGGKEGQSEYF